MFRLDKKQALEVPTRYHKKGPNRLESCESQIAHGGDEHVACECSKQDGQADVIWATMLHSDHGGTLAFHIFHLSIVNGRRVRC